MNKRKIQEVKVQNLEFLKRYRNKRKRGENNLWYRKDISMVQVLEK